MADAARRRPTTRAILDMALGDDGIVIHEHPDGNFTIDVGSERLIVDPEHFREFIHRLAMFGRQKGWVYEQKLKVTYAKPKAGKVQVAVEGSDNGTPAGDLGDAARTDGESVDPRAKYIRPPRQNRKRAGDRGVVPTRDSVRRGGTADVKQAGVPDIKP